MSIDLAKITDLANQVAALKRKAMTLSASQSESKVTMDDFVTRITPYTGSEAKAYEVVAFIKQNSRLFLNS